MVENKKLCHISHFTAALTIFAAAFIISSEKLQIQPNLIFDLKLYYPLTIHLILSAVWLVIGGFLVKSVKWTVQNISKSWVEFSVFWPLFLFSAVSLVLAVQALWQMKTGMIWIALLFIPGVIGIWVFAILFENVDEDDEANRSFGYILIDIGKWIFRAVLIGAGFIYWGALESVLTYHEALSQSKTLGLFNGMADDLGEAFLRFFITILLFLILAVIGYILKKLYFSLKKKRSYSEQQLSDLERRYISASQKEMEKYLGMKKDMRIFQRTHFAFYVFFFVAILISAAPIVLFNEFILPIIAEQNTKSFQWGLYTSSFGVSGVLIIFSTIFLYWSLYLVCGRLWPSFAEWAVGQTNFPWSGGIGPQYSKLNVAIDQAVREERISLGMPFSPNDFLRQEFYRVEKPFYLSATFMVLLTLFFMVKDLSDYNLFTPKHIEHVDYWSSKKHITSYSDVKGVEINCSARKSLSLSYYIVLNDQNKINIFSSNRRIFRKQFGEYERVNNKLRGSDISFLYTSPRNKFGYGTGTSKQACVSKIKEVYDEPLRSRVLGLLFPVGD